ncbi:MAG TPA: energy transducer TonB [Nannocystaceae bacterium]|nr:energy transducer TonB [Nannocystaceae bacterium]
MSRRSSEGNWVPLLAVLLASFGVHLLLWPLGNEVLDMAWHGRELPRTEGVMEVALLDEDEQPEEIPEEDDEQSKVAPGNLVQLDQGNNRKPEHDTKYVSEFDNRTSSPTRAPNIRPQRGAMGQPGTTKDGNEGKADSPDPLRPQALPLMTRDSDDQNDDLKADDRGELPRAGEAPHPPSLGSAGTRKAMKDALGNPGSFDNIDDSVPAGLKNDLETTRWAFASFFNRVRNGVAQHWHPETLHAANDPDGTKYGTKTRKTRLLISLNPDGTLHRVKLDESCDIDYLDEEAIRAVRTAAPFVNPPPGLVDPKSGLIEFGFGFIFEFRGERRIFRYKR